MENLLPHIEIETAANPDTSVIWLHGLGANGHDFEPIVKELGLPASAAIRFIFPHAPSIPITINGGMVMPGWYDILEMTIERSVDETQLRDSARAICAFVNYEIARGIDSKRIVLAGFSQGGAVAVEVALTFPHKLAGLLLMSTYFATKDSIRLSDTNKDMPIEIQHGAMDPVVPVQLAQVSADFLLEKGFKVSQKKYPMEHSVCIEQIRDISQWLKSLLQL